MPKMKPTTFCTFGDSLVAEGASTTNPSTIYLPSGATGQNVPFPYGQKVEQPGYPDVNISPLPTGNTVTGYVSRGFVYRAMMMAKWPLRDIGNFGVSGDTTGAGGTAPSGMKERIGYVLAAKPDVVIMGGGKNDYAHGIPASGPNSSIENLRWMYEQFEKEGIIVIDFTVSPSSAATQDKYYHESLINYFKMDYAARHANHYCVDIAKYLLDYSSLANSYGVGLSANFRDGLHYNAIGAGKAAIPLAELLKSLFPSTSYQPTYNTIGAAGTAYRETVVWNKNPLLLLGSGQAATAPCTGTGPQYWGTYRSGTGDAVGDVAVVTQASLAAQYPNMFASTDPGYAVTIDISGQSASEVIVFQGQNFSTPADGSGPWIAEADIEAVASSGTIDRLDLAVYVATAATKDLFGTYCNRSDTSDPLTATSIYGRFRTPEFYMPVGINSLSGILTVNTKTSIGGAAQVAIKNVMMRKVTE